MRVKCSNASSRKQIALIGQEIVILDLGIRFHLRADLKVLLSTTVNMVLDGVAFW